MSHCFPKALSVFTHGNTLTISPQTSFQKKVKCEDVKGKKKIQFSLSPRAKKRMAGLEKDEVDVRVLQHCRSQAIPEQTVSLLPAGMDRVALQIKYRDKVQIQLWLLSA